MFSDINVMKIEINREKNEKIHKYGEIKHIPEQPINFLKIQKMKMETQYTKTCKVQQKQH
jgi:hypothetical protein